MKRVTVWGKEAYKAAVGQEPPQCARCEKTSAGTVAGENESEALCAGHLNPHLESEAPQA